MPKRNPGPLQEAADLIPSRDRAVSPEKNPEIPLLVRALRKALEESPQVPHRTEIGERALSPVMIQETAVVVLVRLAGPKEDGHLVRLRSGCSGRPQAALELELDVDPPQHLLQVAPGSAPAEELRAPQQEPEPGREDSAEDNPVPSLKA